MKHVILIPTYNELANIGAVIIGVFTAVPDAHVVVIDDNSPDGTGAFVRKILDSHPGLHLIERSEKLGLGSAYRQVITEILGEEGLTSVITMDGDGSHAPSYLPQLIAALTSYDLVVGSRYVHGGDIKDWERWRFFLSKYGNIYASLLTGLSVRDATSGFIAIRAETLRRMRFESIRADGYAYQIEFKYNAIRHGNASTLEVPIIFTGRRGGVSKISPFIIREGVTMPVRLFLRRLLSSWSSHHKE